MDDFYLGKHDRKGAWRGPPGTHDLGALVGVLEQIRERRTPITLPRFSPEMDDRIAPAIVTSPPDRAFLDGFYLGYKPDDYGALLAYIDLLVFLEMDEATVRARRFAREAELRTHGGGFSPSEMQRFWDEVLEPGMRTWTKAAMDSADLILSIGADGNLRSARSASRNVVEALTR